MITRLLATVAAVATLVGVGAAQELDAVVEVNVDRLQNKHKDIVAEFASDVQRYLNESRFTGEPWNYEPINCSFAIIFQSGNDDLQYSAQVIVRSSRKIYQSDKYSPMLAVNDGGWSFPYERNQTLYFSPNRFAPIESFLDYYANMIIALELDSWDPLAGGPFYQAANQIATQGNSSSYSSGWESVTGKYNRLDMASNAISETYRPFREAIADYHYGLDMIIYKGDRAGGQKYMASLVETLYDMRSRIDMRSVFVKAFFDAKYVEIADYLSDYPDASIFEKLKKIDPQHIGKYNEVLDAR
ncbi:MAG: DUF4835 family protein [Ignavibacteriales bacterium]|nr:DUF4835 family protein [Ignavibacteriales bacterium]